MKLKDLLHLHKPSLLNEKIAIIDQDGYSLELLGKQDKSEYGEREVVSFQLVQFEDDTFTIGIIVYTPSNNSEVHS